MNEKLNTLIKRWRKYADPKKLMYTFCRSYFQYRVDPDERRGNDGSNGVTDEIQAALATGNYFDAETRRRVQKMLEAALPNQPKAKS
jgi:hypothetical protein